jgi:glycosyltransferase involved in cell wall biosynthesis
MRILVLRPQIEAGGASRVIIQLVQALRPLGIEVEVATSGGEWLPKLQELTTCHYLPLYPSTSINLLKSLWGLHHLIMTREYQLLNPHHRFASIACNILASRKQLPVVTTVHEIKTDRKLWSKFAFASHAIVFSRAVKQNLLLHHSLVNDNIFVVPIGVDVVKPTQEQLASVRQEFSLLESVPTISCITRLSVEKGCDTFLHAASLLVSKGYDAKFLLVGDGPQKNELCEMARNLGLTASIHLTGWRNDIPAIIGCSNFLILPSLSEGLGIAIIEGMALAKPTIGTLTGGIPEVIQDSKTGLLVPPGDFNSMADAMISLINEVAFCNNLGHAGQQQYEEHFSSEHMAKRTSEVYYYFSGD